MSEVSAPDPAVQAMRLRAEPPKPLRLSRKVALTGAAGLTVAIAAAAVVGLSTQDDAAPAQELTPSSAPPPDAVRALPGDYAAPRLGPPLPGDLGRPILNARNAADAEPASPTAGSVQAASTRDADAREAERARRHAEADAARTSALMIAQGGGRSVEEEADDARGGPTQGPAAGASAPAIGALRLRAGSIIEASLMTGVQSDLPGPVLGQITADVYDSDTGRRLLIPKGSRLIGGYSAQIAQGQSRLQVLWTRIILPDGASIALEDQAASDPRGYAGAPGPDGFTMEPKASLGGPDHPPGDQRRRRRRRGGRSAGARPAGWSDRRRGHARPGSGGTRPVHSAAPDPASRPDLPHHPQSGPGSRSLRRLTMTTLKLSGLQDDTPVKLSVELPAETHRDLVLYAHMLSSDAERPYSPAQLVAPMLSRFMATDRAFVAERHRAVTSRAP